jgi:pSer/pThr/pTyr-binding forkhead associated (FHA) protein
MPLQLRLTHSLGERLIDLEPTTADRPHIVGQSTAAQVEIPSSSVAKRHCLLFVQGGQWYVQDAASPTGTFLNGHRLADKAAVLKSGDVIRVGRGGSNAPALVVDPNRLGVSELPEESSPVAAPSVPRSPPPPPPSSRPQSSMLPPPVARPPGARAPYVPAAPPPRQSPSYGAPQAPAAPVDEWANIPRDTRLYVPRPKGSSRTTIAIVTVITLGLLVGGGFWIHSAYQKQLEATKPHIIVVNKSKSGATTSASSIFDFNSTQPATRTIVVQRPQPVAPEPAATEPAPDPRKQDPEWKAVELARYEDPVLAIVHFNDYFDRFSDTPFKKELDQFTEESVDQLWWKRIIELFQERDKTLKEIADRKQQLKESQDPEFKKTLQEELTRYEKVRDQADDIIRNQMKYTGSAPPNLYDSADLALHRSQRDPKTYDTWKQQVLAAIKHSHGQRLPWRSTR